MSIDDRTVRHRIVPIDPAGHVFRVTTSFRAPQGAQKLWLPVWIPGSYLVREFPRNITSISTSSGTLAKLDKGSWELRGAGATVEITYDVYAWDLSVRSAHLDQTHGFFNGTSTFLAVEGRENDPQHVELVAPSDPAWAEWRVATTLPGVKLDERGFGDYLAADYDELIDHPVEMGTPTVVTFEAAGAVHEIVVTGRLPHDVDLQRLADDVKPIVESHVAMFGTGLPFDRYLFLLTVVGSGYGGLEHRASTALIASRSDLPITHMQKPSAGYLKLVGLFSHEYFHLWNVKRIKPAAFTPFDLTKEAYTTLLWAFEGITSYYDDLGLLRAGTVSAASWLELVGQQATRVYQGTGRHRQSLADSSFDAWTKFYRQDENAPNAIVSYYTKGSLAAIALDLTLRLRSEGRASLDDVMRTLWARYGQTGVGVPEGGVEQVAAEVLGADLSDFFDAAIRGTDDLPLADLLEQFGVEFHLRARTGSSDSGGSPAPEAPTSCLGGRCVRKGDGWKLANVYTGGAAHKAGLSADDVIIAIDGLKPSGNPVDSLGKRTPGDVVTVHAFRRDELMVLQVELGEPPLDTVWLALSESASEAALARRMAWLGC